MSFPFSNPQKRLDKKLVKAAAKGDARDVLRLLDQGANPNARLFSGPALFAAAYGGDTDGHHQVVELLLARGAEVDTRNGVSCTALMGAASRGHIRAVQLLLAAGADKNMYGRDKNALDWAMTSGSPAMIFMLQEKPPEVIAEPRAETPQEVVFRRPLGNRLLEEIFDFTANERITLIRKGEDGPVEAVTRNSFSEIDDRARLREAFEACVKQGGHPDEHAVFTGILPKPKPMKGL